MNYKGFNNNLKCGDFQYELGKSFEEERAVVYETGFHACENPLDVLSYYPPISGNRYCEVEQSGEISKCEYDGDSKVASTKIIVRNEIGIKDLIGAGINYLMKTSENSSVDCFSCITTTDNCSHVVTTGDDSPVSTMGEYAHAVTSGMESCAITTGDYSHSVTTGLFSYSATTGFGSTAMTTDERTGAVTFGTNANAITMGDYSCAVVNGSCSYASTSGFQSNAIATGSSSRAVTTGEAISVAIGENSVAKASAGGYIVLAEYSRKGSLLCVKSAKVGVDVKPNTWYRLENGEFVEVD